MENWYPENSGGIFTVYTDLPTTGSTPNKTEYKFVNGLGEVQIAK
jgi:hypothetical protein